jgi:hypothetical protein
MAARPPRLFAARNGRAPPSGAPAVSLFLQIFVIAGACYVGVFAREQLLRSRRRRQRRREWRALDNAVPRSDSQTPPHAA